MDNYVLTGPQGTPINLGSYLRGDQPQDYGAAGLLTSQIVENTFVDGGVLSYETANVRHWKFSVLLATGAAAGLDDLGRVLRQIARPGAYMDVQVDGVASANVVRWDVIAGRVEEEYDLAVQRAGRRKASVSLDTQPYGYLPTWILLASAASLGNPGFLTIPGGSIIGDVPGFAELVISSATQTLFFAGEPTMVQDAVLWSGANRTSGFAFWPAASVLGAGITGDALVGDAFAPASQARRSILTNAQGGWTGIGYIAIPSGIEATMRGRWRAFAFARMNSASQPYAALLAGDIVPAANAGAAMGSAGPVATLPSPRYAAPDGANLPVPTGHVMLDLGEVTIPPSGSGIDQDLRLRLWANASWPLGPATVSVDIGGVWLMDLDGPAGVLPRGLAVPTTQTPSVGRFLAESYLRRVQVNQPTGGLSSYVPAFDAMGIYRGQLPMAHPSQSKIDFYVGAHRYTKRYVTEVLADTPQAWYRLSEGAGATMTDSSGNANHGIYQGTPSLSASALTLEPGAMAVASGQFGIASSLGGFPAAGGPRTLEVWYQPGTITGNAPVGYGTPTSGRMFYLFITASTMEFTNYLVGAAVIPYAFQAGQTYHIAGAFGGTVLTGYVNGAYVGTALIVGGLPSTINQGMKVGAIASGNGFGANGVVDEVALYTSALSSDRILQHFLAGKSAYGATSPPMHTNQVISASYRYRPRFGFSRGL